MIGQLMAQAGAGADTMVSGTWLISVLGVVLTALGSWFAKGKVEENKRQRMTLEAPVPEVPVKRVYSPPTYYQHHALEKRVERVEGAVDQLRRDQAEQYRMLMAAGEERKDKIFEKMDGIARGWHQRMDALMKLQGNPNHDPHE